MKKTDCGGTVYYINDKHMYHREDGPAIIYPSGTVRYYVNGISYTEAEFKLIKFVLYEKVL